jgi:selenocysteine-specific elongation factor
MRVARLVLGVIGHVDHGKSALVQALTGAQTDRLVEEQQRGISIALGFAHLETGAGSDIDLIDMPGHERFVRTMISGATGIDAVLLVVAANEGVKPQTLEHVNIAGLLGLTCAVVAVSKTDLVTAEEAQEAADEAVKLLARSGLQSLPPVMTSALQKTGIDELRRTLQTLALGQSARSSNGLAYLPIDRAFSVAGHGPVVTGTLRGGPINPGDTLELMPSRRSVRVRAVQVHRERVVAAMPGQRVAVNLRDVEIAELDRGMSLAAPDTLALSNWLTLYIRAVEGAPPLETASRLRAMLGTTELDVRLRLLDRDVLEPGASGFAQLRCLESVVLPAGEHVILRLASPAGTVAGGRVLETGTRRLRRNAPRTLERLEDLRSLTPVELIAAEVERAGATGTTLKQLSRLCALSAPRIVELLQTRPFVITQSGLVVRKAEIDSLVERIPLLLSRHTAGLSPDKLLAAFPAASTAVMEEATVRLVVRGLLIKRGTQLVVPRPEEDRAQARNEAELAAQIAEKLRLGGLTPPNPSSVMTDLSSKRAVDRLLRAGVVVRCVDRAKEREILFHRDAIKEAQRRLAPLLERAGGLLVTEISAALGISRKYSMPLLDHLDAIRFTRRVNDRRIRA